MLLPGRQHGSGLIIVLAILAMLAVMATTFVTLQRIDVRITANYVDDQRCETLARGMLNYFSSILRDGQDRTWLKYVNRDTAVGHCASIPARDLPGLGEESWGTPVSRSFWFYAPAPSWSDWSAMYGDYIYYGSYIAQGSFSFWHDGTVGDMVIGRYWDAAGNREVDAWLDRHTVGWDSQGRIVSSNHPDYKQAIQNVGTDSTYYDKPPFIMYSGDRLTYPKYFPGSRMTHEATLPDGVYWRWGVKLGMPTSTFVDLNVVGNLDGADSNYLAHMGGTSLGALRALDEVDDRAPSDGVYNVNGSSTGSEHLGRLDWKGFPDDMMYSNTSLNAAGGFPRNYDSVFWHPSQAGMEKVFHMAIYPQIPSCPVPGTASSVPVSARAPASIMVGREKARALIHWRWPNGIPAEGTDRNRVGWRRDGATYYRMPTPENPRGSDRSFGTNEAMERDHSVYHPATSSLASILGKRDERAIRPYFNMMSADTILRGKIWPKEGSLRLRDNSGNVVLTRDAGEGDWKHIDILKRVNINIVGASNPNDSSYTALPNQDAGLLSKWYQKSARERDRLYFMLKSALYFTNTATPEKQACQFVASLADMVDRDHDETYYTAPDGSGEWALGVEKFPVINEAAVYFATKADTPAYELTALRFELLNTARNIAWIADADEAYNVSDYAVQIVTASDSHAWRLGDLRRYDFANTATDLGPVTTIGADGIFADANDATHKSWSRILHIGWPKNPSGFTWPTWLTIDGVKGPIQIKLWKPLAGYANASMPIVPGRVDTVISGSPQKYVCVDDTKWIQIVAPYTTGGPGGTKASYLGLYRRYDPMNALIVGAPVVNNIAAASTVVWSQGPNLASATLGKPNVLGAWKYGYKRWYERNFVVVDGDLPTIGWLGALTTWNAARDGPVTWIHDLPTNLKDQDSKYNLIPVTNRLDAKAKFDLFRPFVPFAPVIPSGSTDPHCYDIYGVAVNPKNLHVLDIFTVWDPSNDGVDNDGDGAVDDEDTGLQAGDKGGPEVKVYGRLDVNSVALRSWWSILPNNDQLGLPRTERNKYMFYTITTSSTLWRPEFDLTITTMWGRNGVRGGSATGYSNQGPYETIGDCLRYDSLYGLPGRMWSDLSQWPSVSTSVLGESGPTSWDRDSVGNYPTNQCGDDDGDGIYDDHIERDMMFTWLSNHITTRANVFLIDLCVDICDPPRYPGQERPFPYYRTKKSYARKQLLGLLDRASTLRILPDGTCDFTGPVDTRLIRFADDMRTN